MKVVCISNIPDNRKENAYPNITPGKIYESSDEAKGLFKNRTRSLIWIVDDTGSLNWYLSHIFVSLDEWRERKLKEIGV